MVNKTAKTKKTAKNEKTTKTTKVTKNTGACSKKECCALAPKIAIIVLLAAAVMFLIVMVFVMFIKNNDKMLTCDYAYDESGTNIHLEYSYNASKGRPNSTLQVIEMKATDEKEAADWVTLRELDENDETYETSKYWSEGNSFYSEISQNKEQIEAVLADEDLKEEYDYAPINDTKAELEEMGYVCSVK